MESTYPGHKKGERQKKKKEDLYFIYRIYSKWITDPYVKPRIIKLLEESTREFLWP